MKRKTLFLLLFSTVSLFINAQSPVGRWKKISHLSEYAGEKFDSHKALLEQRPCAAKIVWEIKADGSFRQNTANSGCDEKYKNIQQKLYAKTQWKFVGNKFTTSASNFAVGQSYTVVFSGNKMIMTGTEGQGVITYQRL